MLKESVTAASPVNFRDFPTPVMMPSSGINLVAILCPVSASKISTFLLLVESITNFNSEVSTSGVVSPYSAAIFLAPPPVIIIIKSSGGRFVNDRLLPTRDFMLLAGTSTLTAEESL